MKLFHGFYLVLFFFTSNFSQSIIDFKTLRSKFATMPRQEKDYQNAIEKTSLVFTKELSADNAEEWGNALENAQLYYIKDTSVARAITRVLTDFKSLPVSIVMTAIEVGKTLFPENDLESVRNILAGTNNIYLFAYAANYSNEINPEKINDLIHYKFTSPENHPVLECLLHQIQVSDSNKFSSRPDIISIIDHPFMDGSTIIYSFFRNDRKYPGLSIIKKPDGTFVKDAVGNIFSIPQFSMSYANLPGYLRNGNTPEGIFSIVGSYISPTESIGPSRNVLTRIAFEVTPEIFYHGNNMSSQWNIEEYRNLLPEDWQDYFPAYEAFYAGQARRKVIVMHGSADDLRFFKNESYFPHTPTKGCISSIELWNPETGYCTRSDQTDLINAFRSTGSNKGFLVVIELDDKDSPVLIDDIMEFLQ